MTAFNIEYAISARDALTPVLKRAQAQLKSMEKSLAAFKNPVRMQIDTKQAQAQIGKLKSSMAGIGQGQKTGFNPPAGGGGGKVGGYASAGTDGLNAGLFTRMGAGGAAAAAGFAAAGFAAKAAIGGAIDLETAQLGLRKAFDLTTEQIQPYTKELRSLSSGLGIAQEDVTNLATQYAKADGSLNPAQLKEITQLTIASSKAWDVSSETVQDSFGLMKAIYGQNTAELTKTANTIDLLGDKFGVLNEGYLTQFITQGGAVANSMGLTSAGMLAYGAAAGEMKIEAGTAANALKILNASMADKGSAGGLSKLGINFEQLQKLKPEEKIGQVLSALNEYKGADKAMVASDIIGKHYDDTLISLAVSADKYGQALALAGDESQSSGRVMKALGLEGETTQGKIDRARETVKNFGISAGDVGAQGLAFLIDSVRSAADWFNGSSRSAEVFKTVLVGIITVINPIAGLAIVLYNVYQSSSALRGAFEGLGTAFAPLAGLFGDGGEAGNQMDMVFKGIGATLAVVVDTVATLIDGFLSLIKISTELVTLDFSGMGDTAKGFASRLMDRGNKLYQNVKSDFSTPSPIQAQAAAAGGVKAQAGVPQAAGGGAMQTAANTQVQAASTAAAAASVTQSASNVDTAAATLNAQSALTQQTAATTQASVGNQFVTAAAQMMAAAQTMMTATSRPLTVNVSGGGSMGDQGR